MKTLKIYKENVNDLTNEEFAMIRKNSFGASDIAVLFNMGFQKLEELIDQKACLELTPEELNVSNLPNVRKGRDLEPLILEKYRQATGKEIFKPKHMYEVFPGLTVNFDGIEIVDEDEYVPVEAKYVSAFAHKYWSEPSDEIYIPEKRSKDIEEHIQIVSKEIGIPPYYYTQLQTQIYGLQADEGVLAALWDKDWNLRIYRVAKDHYLFPYLELRVKLNYPKILQTRLHLPEVEPEVDENFTF